MYGKRSNYYVLISCTRVQASVIKRVPVQCNESYFISGKYSFFYRKKSNGIIFHISIICLVALGSIWSVRLLFYLFYKHWWKLTFHRCVHNELMLFCQKFIYYLCHIYSFIFFNDTLFNFNWISASEIKKINNSNYWKATNTYLFVCIFHTS